MLQTRLPDRRFASIMCLLVILGSSCAKAPKPGVNVKALTADLVFGIPPLDEPVPPPNASLAEEPELELRTGVNRPRRSPTPKPPPLPCPEADRNEFVGDPPLQVQGRPKSGLYRWKVTGPIGTDVESPAAGYTRTTQPGHEREILPFIERLVFTARNDPDDANAFTFQTQQREAGSARTVRQTFRVDPDLGIFLTEIIQNPGGGAAERGFRLSPPIKLLPLPVVFGPAGRIDGKAVNEEGNLDVLQITGQVSGQFPRIDACGDVVSTVKVDAELQYTTTRRTVIPETFIPRDETVTIVQDYNYYFATQMGGLIVFEHFETPPCGRPSDNGAKPPAGVKQNDQGEWRYEATGRCAHPERPFTEFDTNLGQIDPGPLPEETD